MHLSVKFNKSVAAALIAAMFVAGCAAPGGNSYQAEASSSECNPLLAAGIGAVVGGLIGGSKHRAGGLAIGAGLGALACVAINNQSEQVKSAKQVRGEYMRANRGYLPDEAKVVKYETRFTPSAFKGGQQAQSQSYIEVAPGARDPNPRIEEELTLYKADGSVLNSVRKPVTGTASAGAFRNVFTIPMPEGVPQGMYPVKTALYVNNNRVSERNLSFQIVRNSHEMEMMIVALN